MNRTNKKFLQIPLPREFYGPEWDGKITHTCIGEHYHKYFTPCMFSQKPFIFPKSHWFSRKYIAFPLFHLFRWYISPEFWPVLCVTHHCVLPCACTLHMWVNYFFPPMNLSFDNLIHTPQRHNLRGQKNSRFSSSIEAICYYSKAEWYRERWAFISNCVSATYLLSEAYVLEELWSNASLWAPL